MRIGNARARAGFAMGAALTALLAFGCASPTPEAEGLAGNVAAREAATGARPASVLVDGDLPRSARFTAAELESLGAADVEWSMHGDQHVFRAVAVEKVLFQLGFVEGPGGSATPPAQRRSGWRHVILATAQDGYQTAFSAAEISAVVGPTRAFLAWAQDGGEIPAAEGPFRLVVPTDRKGARSVRQLARLTVIDLRSRDATTTR